MFNWPKWEKLSLLCLAVTGLFVILLTTVIAVKINKKKRSKNLDKKGSQAKKINEYVLEMLSDNDFVEFCKNFSLEKTIPRINDLSFSFLPVVFNKTMFEYKMNYSPIKKTQSPYLKTLNTYSKEYIKLSQNDIARAYLCVNKEFDGKYRTAESEKTYRLEACISKPYKKLWDAFYSLQDKGVLKKRDSRYYFQAFCFVLYYEALKIFSEENVDDLKEQGLSPKDSDSKIIRKLHESGFRKDDILTILCMNNVTKQNACCAVRWKDSELKKLIEREIEKLKSSDLVERYLPDRKRNNK